jgi:uncharacterized protein
MGVSVSGQAIPASSFFGCLIRFFKSEAGATLLWAASAVVLAAIAAPWLYWGGKNFGIAAETHEFPVLLEWLGAACLRADFSRYFCRALVISAVVLLPFLLRRLRPPVTGSDGLWRRVTWKSALLQCAVGWLIAGGLLYGMERGFAAMGAYTLRPHPVGSAEALGRSLVPALVVSLVEEWLFRGVLLGLWLRFSKPLTACIGTALIFALVHFLKLPAEAEIAPPTSMLAGFVLLGKLLWHFTESLFFIADFMTLFVLGLILAHARLRTGALWFSLGLHAGWIMAFKGFNLRFSPVLSHPLHPWWVGETLRSGLLPLLTLSLTAVVCHQVLRRFEPARVG